MTDLLNMIAAQLRQPPTTENVGSPQDPIWKVSAQGEEETPEQAMARWLMQMSQQLNQGDPDENYMSDLQDIFPEQPEIPDAQ
jgi:hypothetical protein